MAATSVKSHDLLVIGGGPGGYVAAIRAAQLGLDAAVVERETLMGGTCLRIGCIPSKALLESSERYEEAKDGLAVHGIETGKLKLDLARMQARKTEVLTQNARGIDGLLTKNKVTRYSGSARFVAPGRVVVAGGPEIAIASSRIIVATGSRPATLAGVELDGAIVGTSTEALAYDAVPEHLVVIGAGYIGLELGSVWRRLGARVTVVEYLERVLPGLDHEIASEAQRIFTKQGLVFRLGAKVVGARKKGRGAVVEIEGDKPITADRVLLAVGRTPYTEGLGLTEIGIKPDAKGFIPVDPAFATAVPGVFAVGDVIGGAMLAHKAEEEGIACVEGMINGYGHVNYDAIPAVVFTRPEIAAVGKTEDELKRDGVAYVKGMFPFRANARARATEATEGRVKILAAADTDRVLGVHIIGAHAGDLIAEATAAIEFGASSEDLARTCHAHPTLAEAVKEAALAVAGRAIHT